jgi:hypothetical protein
MSVMTPIRSENAPLEGGVGEHHADESLREGLQNRLVRIRK